ncbi:hypothetical protein J1N35_022304 [Gossypium stocksii]|uniref:DUF659 domain-containing protein n=1 Tax=Gossypium stocksii TaxID=47602 RepID=A0A9D3VGF0_9ROSI|nr:hypothetical protein J1N35_022304 [Gossypium stocksii]
MGCPRFLIMISQSGSESVGSSNNITNASVSQDDISNTPPWRYVTKLPKTVEGDSEIARTLYSNGLPFHLARNPHYVKAFTLASKNSILSYIPSGYNALRTTLLQKERVNIERLLQPIKGMWREKDTRFASMIVMLKRLKLIKRGLQNMVISDEWSTYREDDVSKASLMKEKILDDF